jgi:L-fuculose-phosphate aldolase
MASNQQEQQTRSELLAFVRKMQSDKLTAAKSGNISMRVVGGFLITPTGIAYEDCDEQAMVFVDDNGCKRETDLQPSSEWRFHHDIYQQKPRVNAVVHTHSNAATALACLAKPVPAFHYMVALFGGSEIPCAKYATFGTAELSSHVLAALAEPYTGCLMQNHGAITLGKTMAEAYQRAEELEALCQQYALAMQCGEVNLLSDEQMVEAKAAFAAYGQAKKVGE